MLIDKFLDYVKYETTSIEDTDICPSNPLEINLANHLFDELNRLGLKDTFVSEYGYVYGRLVGDENKPTIGLCAHMDTSPDASGKDVKARIIENYDGKDIKLNDELFTTVSRFPNLKNYIGKTLVVTDGTTLLGADDKAGIAIIMETLENLVNNKELKHGDIVVCFTPDEEIGKGADKIDYERFKVDFAYTVDGGEPNFIEYENFNAASAHIELNGISVHPGSAKNKMVNASKLAFEFDSLLDSEMVPEKTQGYEGFNHCTYVNTECGKGIMEYIIRNHDASKLEQQKQMFVDAKNQMNNKYGYNAVNIIIKDQYKNMKEKFVDNMYPIELVKNAMLNKNMNYTECAIRGGTDGARITWDGILCPNLGTGGQNYHGVHEFWCKEDGEEVVNLLVEMFNISVKQNS